MTLSSSTVLPPLSEVHVSVSGRYGLEVLEFDILAVDPHVGPDLLHRRSFHLGYGFTKTA